MDEEEVLQQAQIKSWLWLKHKGNKFTYSFSDWVLNPMICIRLKFAGWWWNRERKGVSFRMVNLHVVQMMAMELGGCMSG